MRFHNAAADLFVPDGAAAEAALARTTHLCITAHQDDIEIMAYHGIGECFGQKDKRLTEQRKAAYVGEYACQIQLGFPSSMVKNPSEQAVINDLAAILRATRPEV